MLGIPVTKRQAPWLVDAFRAYKLRRTDDEIADQIRKSHETKMARYGTLILNRGDGLSWKAGWREVAGRRIFFRSMWEANWGRYLQWLKDRGGIVEWEHEPETFWFEKIRRGTRSYLPDFRVTERNGSIVYHEVKGWMDDRSKTKIARMARYHPKVKLIVIEKKQYHSVGDALGKIIPEWETKVRAPAPIRVIPPPVAISPKPRVACKVEWWRIAPVS
jgi:hypothetical protein